MLIYSDKWMIHLFFDGLFSGSSNLDQLEMMEIWKDFSRVSWIIKNNFPEKNADIRTSGSSWSEWIQMDFRWLGPKFGRPTRWPPHIMPRLAAHPQNLWWESPMANGKKKHMRFLKKGKFILKLFVFRSKKQSFGGNSPDSRCRKTWPGFRKSSNFRRRFSLCLARDWAVNFRQTKTLFCWLN